MAGNFEGLYQHANVVLPSQSITHSHTKKADL